jgi:putative ABC transport system permease protein
VTAVWTRILGRLPIGLLQLTHNPGRFLAALAGVAFANVLVFVQLGLAGSLNESVATPYRLFHPDLLLLSAYEADMLSDGATVPRQRLYQALAHPDVVDGTPLYLAKTTWLSGNDDSSSIQVFGLRSDAGAFVRQDLRDPLRNLSLEDTALVDMKTRRVDMGGYAASRPEAPVPFELQNRQLNAIGTVSIGGGFGGEGVFIMSEQTFFHIFPRRSSATPSHVLVAVRPGADPGRVANELVQLFPEESVRIRTVAEASADEQRYQLTQRPTGLIFAFGVGIGIVVGIVIAYQVLSTDVADHIREYATLKAMGYRSRFFAGIVLEEALILAAIGFWPGLALSQLFYATLARLASLPIFMTPERAAVVFVGTVIACSISGLMAMRRLAAADPADLF